MVPPADNNEGQFTLCGYLILARCAGMEDESDRSGLTLHEFSQLFTRTVAL